jgi:hypothetical protein
MIDDLKILFIGGNHLRHLYYLNEINKIFPITSAIIENRVNGTSEKIPVPPSELSDHDKNNFLQHFSQRLETEKVFFGNQILPDIPILNIEESELNSQKTTNFVKLAKPDIVLIFGCHLIKDPLLSVLPKHSINLHGGLSPRYRGTATMFWPFYFLEPNHVGTTFHYIVSEPDAGNVIHQSTPTLDYGDKIHDVACKTILESAKDAIKLIEIFKRNKKWNVFKQKYTGKNFLENDFRAEHLRIIYDLYSNEIVDHFLDKKIKPKHPNLIKQF